MMITRNTGMPVPKLLRIPLLGGAAERGSSHPIAKSFSFLHGKGFVLYIASPVANKGNCKETIATSCVEHRILRQGNVICTYHLW